jgi:hypothetical protein
MGWVGKSYSTYIPSWTFAGKTVSFNCHIQSYSWSRSLIDLSIAKAWWRKQQQKMSTAALKSALDVGPVE